LPSLPATEHQLHTAFDSFRVFYGKVYQTQAAISKAYATFKENTQSIHQWNVRAAAINSSAVYGYTEYADLTPQEFALQRLMPKSEPEPLPLQNKRVMDTTALDLAAPPASFNWINKGAVTPVKNQGSAGTCWAFSAVQNIEGQWFLSGHSLVALSVEEVVECDYFDCGVFGGWPSSAFKWIIGHGGLETEAQYPYCCGGTTSNVCYPCMAQPFNASYCGSGPEYCNTNCSFNPNQALATISNWVGYPNNATQILAAAYSQGPLSVALDASELQFYLGGVIHGTFCSKTALDHAVLIVGWGSDSLGTPYWVVKNSWGTSWGVTPPNVPNGQRGYFLIERGNNACGIESTVTSALM